MISAGWCNIQVKSEKMHSPSPQVCKNSFADFVFSPARRAGFPPLTCNFTQSCKTPKGRNNIAQGKAKRRPGFQNVVHKLSPERATQSSSASYISHPTRKYFLTHPKNVVSIFLAIPGRLHILLRFVNEQETAVLSEKVKLCISLSGYARIKER